MNIVKEFYKFPLFWMGIAVFIALTNFFILPNTAFNLLTAVCQSLLACFFLYGHKNGFTVDLVLSLLMTLAFIATVLQISNLYT